MALVAHEGNTYRDPHENPLEVEGIFFELAGISLAGEKTFMGKGGRRIPKLPITHEKMLIHNYAGKLKAANALKAGSTVLGGVGYGMSTIDYAGSMKEGNYREARKSGVDIFISGLGYKRYIWSVILVVGMTFVFYKWIEKVTDFESRYEKMTCLLEFKRIRVFAKAVPYMTVCILVLTGIIYIVS